MREVLGGGLPKLRESLPNREDRNPLRRAHPTTLFVTAVTARIRGAT